MMGEFLPDGTLQSEYAGLCRRCGKQIAVNQQGQPERCERCERRYQQALQAIKDAPSNKVKVLKLDR